MSMDTPTDLPEDYRPPDPVLLDAVALSTAIRSRSLSCREVMAAFLDHIDVINPNVNAIVSLRERAQLLTEAEERDRELDRGIHRGWLHGIPQAIKDVTPTAGIPTTFGSPLLRNNIPDTDALLVQRVRRDGAIVIGKTNTPELGLGSQTYNSVFGPTRNAYDHSLTAGGSSGGAAVALATRMLPVADGSDVMGSLRNPAAYNNVIGFRPTFNRIPQNTDSEVFAQQLATSGPMGRTTRDVARLLATQAGYDVRSPLTLDEDPQVFTRPLDRDCAGLRLGWIGDWNGYLPMQPGVLELCEQALATFEDMGCAVEAMQPAFRPERLWQAWLALRHWMVAGSLGALYGNECTRSQLKPEAQWEVEGGIGLTAMNVYRASGVRTEWFHTLVRHFETYDFLLMPTAQVFPFDVNLTWPREINGVAMDTYHRWMEVAVPASLAGVPAISMPAGFNAQGRPMGLQILGPPRGDFAVLQLAHAYEQANQWIRDHPPPIGI